MVALMAERLELPKAEKSAGGRAETKVGVLGHSLVALMARRKAVYLVERLVLPKAEKKVDKKVEKKVEKKAEKKEEKPVEE